MAQDDEILGENEPELDLGVEETKEPEQKEPEVKEDGIAELKRQLEAEKALRIEAQRTARSASEEAAKARNDVDDTNLHLVKASIDTVKGNIDTLKQNYAAALANGDFGVAADIQMEMSVAANKLVQLETGKQAMEEKPKVKPAEIDPVNQFIDSLSARSASWLRNHKECVTDPTMNRKMLLAHALAVDDGLEIDSDEYFNLIEQRLGYKKTKAEVQEDDDPMKYSAKEEKETTPAAAPVSRGEGKKNSVRLTAEEREIASLSGMTDEEYARNKQEISKEKRYN